MKVLKFILPALMLALVPEQSPAQNYTPAPVTISTEMKVIGEHLYYVHKVLEKQTLYSISKAYNVPVDEIFEANKGLKEEGLKKDSLIYIPVISKNVREAASAAEKPAQKPAAKAVEPAENVPASDDIIKDGKTIHTVKWYEDLESIARKYKVDAEDIIKENNLQGRKITKGQNLIIPSQPAAKADIPELDGKKGEEESSSPASKDTIQQIPAQDALYMAERPQETVRGFLDVKREMNMVLMLPLQASSGSGNQNYMDFYSGLLLAVRDKARDGINVDLKVYDTTRGIPEISNTDVILGPVSPEELTKVLNSCPENTPVVSPMNPKAESLSDKYANFIQAPPSSNAQLTDMVSWLKEDMSASDNILVIYEKTSKENSISSKINKVLKDSGLRYNTFSYNVLDGSHITASIQSKMSAHKANRVIIASEKEAFVNDVCRNLSLIAHENYDITLYGNSKFKNYETLEIDWLHTLNLHMSASYNVNYNSAKAKDFIMKYRALFNTEPEAFAFQGYDLGYYLIDTFSRHSWNWREYICSEKTVMLQTDFLFSNTEEDAGFVNKAVKRTVYGPDYSETVLESVLK